MRGGRARRCLGLGLTFCLATAVKAQTAPPANVTDALTAMAARASVIFAGHVVAIDREDASGFVDIQFRVDEPVRGVSQNSIYIMREWSGLWTGGIDRYKVGQQRLMLLHARGPSGMSSPVDGQDGAIPIVPGGAAPLAQGTGTAPAETLASPPEPLIDLRWIAARTLRLPAEGTGGQSSGTAARLRLPNGPTVPADPAWFGPVAPLPATAIAEPLPGSSAAHYSLVLNLLKGGAVVISEPVKKPSTFAARQP